MKTKQLWGMLLVLALGFLPKLQAQSSGSAGVMFGLSNSSIDVHDRFLGIDNSIIGSNLLGYSVGFYGQVNSGPVFFRPGLEYQFNAGTISSWGWADDFRLHKLELPLVVGIKIAGPFSIEAGPTWDYVLAATRDYGDEEVYLAKMGLGYRVGAGLQFDRMFFNLNLHGTTYYRTEASGRAAFSEPFKISAGMGVHLN